MARARSTSRRTSPVAAAAPAGSEEAFNRFLPAAREIESRDVIPARADVQLAAHNVRSGVQAVLAHEAVVKRLPGVEIADLRTLPDLALGVVFAATRVDRSNAPSVELPSLFGRSRELRTLLLSAAETLALAGLLPARAVEKVRAGSGAIDSATDCVELSALFKKNAAKVRGKTPVTAAQAKEAGEVGSRLLALLKPKGAPRKREAGAELKRAVDERDRLWTLLVRRHDVLWRAGAFVFGRAAVDAAVPALQSRASAARPSAPTEPAAPPAGGGNPTS